MSGPTVHELEVLNAVIQLGSVKAAAYSLGIADSTAKNLLARLYKRLGATSAYQAVAAADDLWGPGWRAPFVS